MQHKIQYVWITKNPHSTDVHIYELQLKAKCHKLHKLEKEKLKQLQELNRHLILPNFIVKKRNCAVIWPNWTQNWFQTQLSCQLMLNHNARNGYDVYSA